MKKHYLGFVIYAYVCGSQLVMMLKHGNDDRVVGVCKWLGNQSDIA